MSFFILFLIPYRLFLFRKTLACTRRRASNSSLCFLLSQVSHEVCLRVHFPLVYPFFSLTFKAKKYAIALCWLKYVCVRCVIICYIVDCKESCDTCDSKKHKTPVLCAYACARERWIIGFFTVSIPSAGWSTHKIRFMMCLCVCCCIKVFVRNDTLIYKKRYVDLQETIRSFTRSDTLFYKKRHVVLQETTRCFIRNDTLFYGDEYQGRTYGDHRTVKV